MSDRRRRRRTLIWIVLLPIAVLAGVLVVRIGVADVLVRSDPARALRWWPTHRDAMLQLARQTASKDTAASAAAAGHARAVLRRTPFDGEAYALLAEQSERSGDVAHAAKLYAIASQHAPRNRRTHAWLADHYAAQADFALMLGQIDELLRMMVRGQSQLFPAVAALSGDPDASKALVRFLGNAAPPWREEFLRWFAARAANPDALGAVFAPLRDAAVPLMPGERAAWVDRLMRDGRVGQAYFLWVDGLAPERRERIGNVYDGGFEMPPDNDGFGWRFARVPGASIRQEAVTGATQTQALLVEFYDQRVPFEHVQQRLALPPGSYQFSGRVRPDELRSARGLQWLVRCGGGAEVAATARFHGSADWRTFSVDFAIPASDCAAQTLQLKLDARIKPEQMIGGRIWFDELRIVRRD